MSEKMSPPGKKHNRSFKNMLINPAFQLRYIFWMSATGIILIGFYSFLFYRYMRENYSILVDLSPMTDEAKAQLYRELTEIIVRLGVISLGFLVVVAFVGIIHSHRTAGPLYHFKKVFDQVSSGSKDARMHLRPTDEFQDVAAAFNQMMDSLTKR